MEERIQITQEGYNELQKEYDHLVHVERPEVIAELAAARAQGDLSENADYDVARDKQAKLEARIRDLDVMIQNAEIVQTPRKGARVVRMGSVITVTDLLRNIESTYTIVGTYESDPLAGKISNTAPLGAAVMDHKAGDIVTVNAAKPYQLRIDKIA